MIKDVLVFTPVYRLEPETINGLFALEWEGPLSILFQRDNPTGEGKIDHYHQYKRGRELFLAGKSDAMMIVESDILPPPDALKRLVALDADIAYGAYMLRMGNRKSLNILERYPEKNGRQAKNPGEPLNTRGLWAAAQRKGIIKCSGAGLGIVLIKREVLAAVPFKRPAGKYSAFCDTQWTADAYQAGYKMKADARLHAGHKTPEGQILWPERAT